MDAKNRLLKLRNFNYCINIYINSDRTILELKSYKRLKEEIKQKRAIAEHNNLNIRYVIRNNKIVEGKINPFVSIPRSFGVNVN